MILPSVWSLGVPMLSWDKSKLSFAAPLFHISGSCRSATIGSRSLLGVPGFGLAIILAIILFSLTFSAFGLF